MCALQKAAPWVVLLFLFLWPQIVRCLILPENLRRDENSQARLLLGGNSLQTIARLPEIIAYNQNAKSITFKISCDDCTEEEKQGFGEEAISVEVFPNGIQSCGYADDVGLSINGQRLIPNTGLNDNIQSYYGSLGTNNGGSSTFDKIRWTNICGCLNALPGEDCGDNLESVLIFEVPGMRGSTPGFTLSYKQYGGGRLLRLSNFPDMISMDRAVFGRSPHWKSPLLQLQVGSLPASTLLSTFSSVIPSMTTSAVPVAHTGSPDGHVSTPTEVQAPSTTPPLPAPTPALSQPLSPPSAPVLNVQGPGSWHDAVSAAEGIAAFEHSLTAIWNKAQSAAQSAVTSLHSLHMCSKDGVSQTIKALKEPAAFVPATPSNTARAKIPTASGSSELPDTFSIVSDSRDPHVTSRQTIVALQITILIMIILALATSIFVLIRRNPRLRAEMAAQREERRNKRLFRRAACNYRWRKALGRFRALRLRGGNNDVEKDSDADLLALNDPIDYLERDQWPEKRNSTEAVVVTNIAGIREGLRELRKAHQLVDNMMTAEEGRFDRMGRVTRHHRSWSDSANSDKTAPPPYEEEEVHVADGMRYVRRVTDTTPDSSVISTSPHSSVVDSDSESEKE